MKFQSPGNTFFELANLNIKWYGICYLLAFFAAVFVAKLLIKKLKEDNQLSLELFIDSAVASFIGGIVGARLWFCTLEWTYFIDHPHEIYQIWLGGQSIQGGLLGGFIAFYCFAKVNKLDLKTKQAIVSITVTGLPFAQALGRWGNFFNEEAFGRPTDLPWKLYISYLDDYFHPTFLYESILNILLGIILFRLFNINTACRQAAIYLGGYSVIRLIVEPMRTDSLLLFGLPAASVIAVFTLIIALILYFVDRDL